MLAESYLAALVAHDPERVAIAPNAKCMGHPVAQSTAESTGLAGDLVLAKDRLCGIPVGREGFSGRPPGGAGRAAFGAVETPDPRCSANARRQAKSFRARAAIA